MNKFCLILALLLPRTFTPEPTHVPMHFVVWNVGQGLWTTWVGDACFHFDAGGERAPWTEIRRACGDKANYFSFSHWDQDHISFAKKAAQVFDACLWHAPGGEGSPRKQRLMSALRPCRTVPKTALVELTRPVFAPRIGRARKRKAASNEMSRVYGLHDVLIPGDATRAEEKTWAPSELQTTKLLVLGHHGSRTSTSAELIAKAPHLLEAIASARKARYGHPHAEVVARLKTKGIAILSTEDWGTIIWDGAHRKRAPHDPRRE